jgi:hypothetical protein
MALIRSPEHPRVSSLSGRDFGVRDPSSGNRPPAAAIFDVWGVMGDAKRDGERGEAIVDRAARSATGSG